jgi:hypothetical protein
MGANAWSEAMATILWRSFKWIVDKHGDEIYDALWRGLLNGEFDPELLLYRGPENNGVNPIPTQAFLTVLRQQAPFIWKRDEITKHLDLWRVRDDAYQEWIRHQVEQTAPSPSVGVVAPPAAVAAPKRHRSSRKKVLVQKVAKALWGAEKPPDEMSTPQARQQIYARLKHDYAAFEVSEDVVDRAIGRKKTKVK